MWGGLGAPWLFVHLKLAGKELFVHLKLAGKEG